MFLIFFRIDPFYVVGLMKFGWQDAHENQYSGKVKNERVMEEPERQARTMSACAPL